MPDGKHIAIDLSKKQIEDCPDIFTEKPVSKQGEISYSKYYNWNAYWNGPYMWGVYDSPFYDYNAWSEPSEAERSWDPHLRSAKELIRYAVNGLEGNIGYIEDFIVDDNTWAIRYFVVSTTDWFQKKNIFFLQVG